MNLCSEVVSLALVVCLSVVVVYLASQLQGIAQISTARPINLADPQSGNVPKGVIILFVCDSNIEGSVYTITSFEAKFNKRHNYPYIIFFKSHLNIANKEAVKRCTESNIKFQQLLESDKMDDYLYKHECLSEYEFYWRLSPWTNFGRDIPFDPFVFMTKNEIGFAFASMIVESVNTAPDIWETAMSFSTNKSNVLPRNYLYIATGISKFSYCLFSPDLDMGSLTFIRSEEYRRYLHQFKDKHGSLSSPLVMRIIHSFGMTMFHTCKGIHYFENLGIQTVYGVDSDYTATEELQLMCIEKFKHLRSLPYAS